MIYEFLKKHVVMISLTLSCTILISVIMLKTRCHCKNKVMYDEEPEYSQVKYTRKPKRVHFSENSNVQPVQPKTKVKTHIQPQVFQVFEESQEPQEVHSKSVQEDILFQEEDELDALLEKELEEFEQ